MHVGLLAIQCWSTLRPRTALLVTFSRFSPRSGRRWMIIQLTAIPSRKSKTTIRETMHSTSSIPPAELVALSAVLRAGSAPSSLPTTGSSRAGAICLSNREDHRGGALAAGHRSDGRNESQNQVCNVGFVLARSSLGVLLAQSNLLGNSNWERRQARFEHWRADQCQTSAISLWFCPIEGKP